jgi:hypothetical protein
VASCLPQVSFLNLKRLFAEEDLVAPRAEREEEEEEAAQAAGVSAHGALHAWGGPGGRLMCPGWAPMRPAQSPRKAADALPVAGAAADAEDSEVDDWELDGEVPIQRQGAFWTGR